MRMQTCRWTELLQMLGVTTIGSHSDVGSQARGDDRHRVLDVFSWHLFPNATLKGLSTHQLPYASLRYAMTLNSDPVTLTFDL